MVFTLPTDPDDSSVLLDRVRSEPRATEVVWLANGDRMAGNFIGVDKTKVKFQTEQGTLSFDQSNVSALAFDPVLSFYPRPQGLFLDLTLSDGSRLGGQNARLSEGQVVATTRFGPEIRFSLGELLAAHPRSPSLVLPDRRASMFESNTFPMLAPLALSSVTGPWMGISSGSGASRMTEGWARRAVASSPIAFYRAISVSRRSWGWTTARVRSAM